MDEDIAAVYEEAREVAAVSRRAGAALARVTLEMLLKRLVGKPGEDEPGKRQIDLYTLLDRVKPKVSPTTRKLLQVLRHVGNEGLHPKDNPDAATVLVLNSNTTDALEALFASLHLLVDELVVAPREANELVAGLPERLRTAIQDEEKEAEEEPGF
jgi:hypothetical protein